MMFKKLTEVTPKFVSQGFLPKAMVGVLSLSLIQCAQPERQAQNGKPRSPAPASPAEASKPTNPGNPSTGDRGGRQPRGVSPEVAAHNDRQKTSTNYLNIDQADESIKNSKESLVQIKINEKTVNGFILEHNSIATVLSTLLPVILKKVKIEEMNDLAVDKIKEEILKIELEDSDLEVKNFNNQSINSNRRFKVTDGTAFRIAKSIKEKAQLKLDSEGAVLVSVSQDSLGKAIDNKSYSGSFCVNSASVKEESSSTPGGTSPVSAPTERTLSIVGFQQASNSGDIQMSEGPLVDLRSAARSSQAEESLRTERTFDCELIAAAAMSSERSLGSPLFENGKVVGMVVRQAGSGDKTRTFGISLKHVN